ncbi:hypothetical protein EYS14_03535 [Alteromonadaceae bacterium M269]|nr:hypothetical protein EYS14_03535 [Alteromonadaceae bacterium M269]
MRYVVLFIFGLITIFIFKHSDYPWSATIGMLIGFAIYLLFSTDDTIIEFREEIRKELKKDEVNHEEAERRAMRLNALDKRARKQERKNRKKTPKNSSYSKNTYSEAVRHSKEKPSKRANRGYTAELSKFDFTRGEVLNITYRDSWGEITNRDVAFSSLSKGEHGQMVKGFCHLRNEQRMFYVSRMISLTSTETGESFI